ncbi:D-alanyl-D-alanine carboxypeptidase [Streptomyces syringium]|uniref:D-alanyl-D-alanine carboxypeptidase n=1 Tax=Streptomyces syringium TaxID=76729 RepID=UPI00345365BD
MTWEFEEASVAGESPDKSEQRKSSGETTGGERDPRLGVFREATVKTSSSESSESSESAKTPKAPKSGSEPVASAKSETASGSGAAPIKGRVVNAIAKPSADSEVEPDTKSEAKPGGKSGAKPEVKAPAEAAAGDDRLKAAVAAWVANGDDTEGADDTAGSDGVKSGKPRESATSGKSTDKPAAGSDEKPADKPAQTSDDKPAAKPAAKPVSEPAAEKSGEEAKAADAPAGKPVDRPTAAFGVVKPKNGTAKPAEAPAKKPSDKPSDKPTDSAADPASDKASDQPTAVFGVVKPKNGAAKPAEAPAKKPSGQEAEADKAADKPSGKQASTSGDQPTALLKAPAVPAAGSAPATGKARPKGTADSDSERTSQFVPLKSDAPAAPAKPAIPVSVTPPAGVPKAPAEAERTKQTPLPPQSAAGAEPAGPAAPLDLLAQLTNTPPPPETPVRTAVRRVKIWTPLVALLLIIFCAVQAFRPLPDPTLKLTASKSYAFEGAKPSLPWPTEGQGHVEVSGLGTMGSFGEQKPVPIGSVAKTMTAYMVLKNHPLKLGENGPMIDIDAKAVSDAGKESEGESVLNTVKPGQKISLRDALSAVMIPSANNIARLLARWDSQSEEAFIKKMNDTAKDLGMKNTTYTDASGLMETTVSTAEDQVKLGKKAMEIPALVAITKLPSWKDPSGTTHRNYNTLVPFNGAIGIKTGSTTKAGGNLLFAGQKEIGGTTQLIVAAVLGQHKAPIIDTVNAVSKKVLIAAQDELRDHKVVKKGDVVGRVDDGLGGTTPVVATKDVTAVGWSGLTVSLALNDAGRKLPHSAKAGTEVGLLTVGSGPGQVRVPVKLKKDLAEPSFGSKLTRLG